MVQEYALFQRVGRSIRTTPLDTSEFLVLKKKSSGLRRLLFKERIILLKDLTQNVKIFKLGKKLLFDKQIFDNDAKKIGLYDYNMFKDYGISYKTFIDFNGPYLKIPVNKGIFQFEYIIFLFNNYRDGIK